MFLCFSVRLWNLCSCCKKGTKDALTLSSCPIKTIGFLSSDVLFLTAFSIVLSDSTDDFKASAPRRNKMDIWKRNGIVFFSFWLKSRVVNWGSGSSDHLLVGCASVGTSDSWPSVLLSEILAIYELGSVLDVITALCLGFFNHIYCLLQGSSSLY